MTERQEPSFDPAAYANAQAASPLAQDALLQALVWLSRHHGRERSAESLLAGVALDKALGPDQAVKLMRDAGFNAGLIQRKIGDIHSLLLPAVLLLKNGDAAIVVERLPEKKGEPTRYNVVMPGPENHGCEAAEDELATEYTGFAFVATPKPQVHITSPEILRDPGSHWLWGTMRRFIPYYRSAMIAALLSNVLMLAIGLITSVVFDKVIPHQAMVTLWALATGGFIAIAFDLIARQLRSHLIDVAGRKADLIIGSLMFRQTLAVRMEHRPESAGSFAHYLGQIEMVRDFFASATLSVLTDLPFIVLFVGMVFIIGGPLGWVLVLAMPLIIALCVLVQGALRRSMHKNMSLQADLQGVLVEAVEGLEDLKTSGAQGRFLRRYEEATAGAAESALRARNLSAWTNNISGSAQQLITLVMLIVGVYLIQAGEVSSGALIGSIMFAGRAIAPLSSVVSLATRYQGARAAMVSLDRLMELPMEREAGKAYVANHPITGKIGLHEVSFAYPAQSGAAAPTVLKGVNLRFSPGERVAILGRIGSGKSTVLRLLAGLYQPTEGMVEVDGIDLRQIDPADFRAKVGFVSQEPRLFKGTLRENVLMGRMSIDAARLTEVAKLTGLDRVIASHPLGWELQVGEMGGLLSGGQRQLVALARSLVTQPQILLMDEPTSSMDAQSEIMFLRQLHEVVGNRTLIMVTHRPAVLELAQRVLVVDAGKVVLDGPKAQVLAALSGQKPAATAAAAAGGAPPNVHMHPSTQPVQREAAV
jgi:ATP-binding cassette subfamily C protein LapB